MCQTRLANLPTVVDTDDYLEKISQLIRLVIPSSGLANRGIAISSWFERTPSYRLSDEAGNPSTVVDTDTCL